HPNRATHTHPAPLRFASLHPQHRNEIMKTLFRLVNTIFCFRLKPCCRYGHWFLQRRSFANEEANSR
ncbi:hypothetical protein, partial [Paraburkholderia gardini]|uniref:hypothetical protein n=1 Tax=Paraburkholderia gardini TaxID=2823469 RepID=UPI001E340F91